ncbi:MAG TPA: TetR family transcriptional regulator [Acidobacteria bacterium]|nr:TetR family transcriptional regulator [Acidobacteriota bacterium]
MAVTEPHTEPHVDTREALLDAAEKLFSEHGIQASSLRMITQQAGANLAAVHYHFGSKEGLVRAVFARRLRPLEEERLRLLVACDEAGEAGVEQVLAAFVAPLLRRVRETPEGGQDFARLMGLAFMEPSEELRSMLLEEFRTTADRFIAGLHERLPHLSRQEMIWRFHFSAGAMAHVVSCSQMVERFSAGLCKCGDHESLLRYLVVFLASGLKAPATMGAELQGEPA